MQILAFDLSLSNSGYAVGDITDGKLTVIEYGSIGTKRFAQRSTGMRLHYIAAETKKIYKKYATADHVVKERSFSNGRITASQQIQKVNGVWEMVGYTEKFDDFTEIPPTTVKKLLTGNGRADKTVVAEKVKDFTGITTKNNDESDALAVLIAYGIQQGLLSFNGGL